MNDNRFEHLTTADPQIVRQFTDHLLRSCNQFINEYPGSVDYIDGLMAAHNFHKAIVAHLVHQTGLDDWWTVALATFQETVERVTTNCGRTPNGDQE